MILYEIVIVYNISWHIFICMPDMPGQTLLIQWFHVKFYCLQYCIHSLVIVVIVILGLALYHHNKRQYCDDTMLKMDG